MSSVFLNNFLFRSLIENDMTVQAKWTAKQFTVSWNPAAGCIITVSRTSSPIANAPTGTLSNGAAIYYGDMLTIAYAAASGYQLTNHGITSATVSDNITAGSIYASTALIGVYVTTANYDDGKYVCKMEIRNVNGHPYFRGWIYNKTNLAEKCRMDVNSLATFNATGSSPDCPAGNGYGFDSICTNITWTGDVRMMIHAFGAAGTPFMIFDKVVKF